MVQKFFSHYGGANSGKPKYITVRIPNTLLDYIDKQVLRMTKKGIIQREFPKPIRHTKAEILAGAVKLGVSYLKSERNHSMDLYYADRHPVDKTLQYSIAVMPEDVEVLKEQALLDRDLGVRVPGYTDKLPTVTDLVLACAVSYYDEVITQMTLESHMETKAKLKAQSDYLNKLSKGDGGRHEYMAAIRVGVERP